MGEWNLRTVIPPMVEGNLKGFNDQLACSGVLVMQYLVILGQEWVDVYGQGIYSPVSQ